MNLKDNQILDSLVRPNNENMSNGSTSNNKTLDDWVIEDLDGLVDETHDLTSSIIATNLDSRIFTDSSFKVSFKIIEIICCIYK